MPIWIINFIQTKWSQFHVIRGPYTNKLETIFVVICVVEEILF